MPLANLLLLHLIVLHRLQKEYAAGIVGLLRKDCLLYTSFLLFCCGLHRRWDVGRIPQDFRCRKRQHPVFLWHRLALVDLSLIHIFVPCARTGAVHPLQNAGRSLHRRSHHRAHQRAVRGAEAQRQWPQMVKKVLLTVSN